MRTKASITMKGMVDTEILYRSRAKVELHLPELYQVSPVGITFGIVREPQGTQSGPRHQMARVLTMHVLSA